MGSDDQAEHRGMLGQETALYDIIMMNMCHCIFVQTHRMYSTKSEPLRKLWTLGDYDCYVGSSLVKNVPFCYAYVEAKLYGKSFDFPLNFIVNLKLL